MDAGHGGGFLSVIGALAMILVAARLAGSACERVRLPSVLGELLVGIVLGNLGLFGVHAMDAVRKMPGIDVLAQIGVLILLFDVGVESDLQKMRAVGRSAFLVACLGVIAPIFLGFGVSRAFFAEHHVLTHWFVGATLAATSVGITARVLSDLGRAASVEGRIILGAAVIDDILGLVVLAVIAGVIQAADSGTAFSLSSVGLIVAKCVAFLGAALVLGRTLSRQVFRFGALLSGPGVLLSLALALCFAVAYAAGAAGLAPIVGAFAAGLVLDEVHYVELRARDAHKRDVRTLLEPLMTFLVPVFFVLMGMSVDLRSFGNTSVLAFAGVLIVAALVGKQVCALGVLERGADRFAVGLGMIPRGEVGLIFASIGASLHIAGEPVVDAAVYAAVVIVVATTTLLTPPLLVWRMRRLTPPRARS